MADCMELVAERAAALADRIPSEPARPNTVESVLAKVGSLPTAPQAIEAVWDGDTIGWFVVLLAVSASPPTENVLSVIRHGGDLRVFTGEVPPWPEAHEATRLGTAVAGRLQIPFHFAAPQTPDDDAPRWWDS